MLHSERLDFSNENVVLLYWWYCYGRCGHFAIYDGHGGRLAAEFAKKHLHLNVLSSGLPRELVCFTLFRFIMSFLFSKQDCVEFRFKLSRSHINFFLVFFLIQIFDCSSRWTSKLLRKPYLMVYNFSLYVFFQLSNHLIVAIPIHWFWTVNTTLVPGFRKTDELLLQESVSGNSWHAFSASELFSRLLVALLISPP